MHLFTVMVVRMRINVATMAACTACTFCHHSFASHEELVRHMAIHHQKERPLCVEFVAKHSNNRPTEMLISERIQTIGHTFVNTVDSFSNSLAI